MAILRHPRLMLTLMASIPFAGHRECPPTPRHARPCPAKPHHALPYPSRGSGRRGWAPDPPCPAKPFQGLGWARLVGAARPGWARSGLAGLGWASPGSLGRRLESGDLLLRRAGSRYEATRQESGDRLFRRAGARYGDFRKSHMAVRSCSRRSRGSLVPLLLVVVAGRRRCA